MAKLLLSDEVDQLLRYPLGRSERLARRGRLPHVLLPDGAIRFDEKIIGELSEQTSGGSETAELRKTSRLARKHRNRKTVQPQKGRDEN